MVFLVGCPRSGTTLLHRLVDAHPELAIVHETLWIPGYYERRAGLTPDGRVTPALLERLFGHRRFDHLGVPPDEVRAIASSNGNGGVPYADFVTALYDRFGEVHGKPLVGDKSPGYVRSIPTLHELWPDARFVHLIRDGREVCLSALGWKKADRLFKEHDTWRDAPVATAALWWERSVRLGREAGALLSPNRYRELRYERLVEDPERECRALCAFLGLGYDDAMVHFYEGRTKSGPGLSTKRRWLPPTAGLRDWRTQMPPHHVAEFETTAGALLDELGYERGATTTDPDLERHAAAVRERFTAGVRQRDRPLPERWA
jgi:hypothetical protein